MGVILALYCMLSTENVARLREAAPDESSAERVIQLFMQSPQVSGPQDAFSLFCEAVDESPHALEEWVEALARLAAWTEARDQSLTLSGAVGYLSCCSESQATSTIRISLGEVLAQMLEDFGYAGEGDLSDG